MPTTPSASSSSSHPLPPKENALFKRILKCYEQKQYKNGLKFAKQILTNPKFSEHGETLSMKGLTLNCLGRKSEAYEYVKRGLRNDLRSHVCWHVYGLLQRSDKQYEEAIKCYRNALRWDKDNIQILRDLSLLQIQMRDLEGYKETRYQLFQLRPTQRASWIGFAMSYHLLSDFDMALKILEEFRKTQQKAAYDYEHSELLLYQNSVIQESGDDTAALEHLNKYQEQICDKPHFLQTKGTLLIKNDKHKQAEAIFDELISRNPENHEYYTLMIEASKLQTVEEKLALFDVYKEKYPKAQTPRRMQLNTASGEKFRELVDPYLRKALSKGVPPIFVDLRPLYSDPEKAKILEEITESYLKNLKAKGSYDESGTVEPATAQLWVLYYLAQHYDFKGDYEKALKLVEEAIEHTPTLIELFLLKSKIYKHVGDMPEAVKWMDEAQSLDTADRYINCKCAKYMLKASLVKEAEEMCQKFTFTREGVSPMDNLNEMQCMWFQTECAAAYKRKGEFGEAIKKCIEVDRHFTEIIEDQFDFHTYCMRKMTLRSYMDLLRLEDVLRSHKFYEKAAHCAISTYLRLHDQPITENDKLNEGDSENIDPSELKKLRNKQKKAKRKAEQEKQQQKQQQARKELHNKSQRKANEEELDSPQKDELIPEKLERPEDPLGEALKFLLPLQQLASKKLKTHTTAFEIYYRKGKPLLMLQCIKRALKLGEEDPRLHGCIIRFQKFIADNDKNLSPPVKEVLNRETASIFEGKTAKKRNEEFTQKYKKSLPHMRIGCLMTSQLEPSSLCNAIKMVTNLEAYSEGVDLATCTEIWENLSNGDFGDAGKNSVDAFKLACSKKFPRATIFRESKEEIEKVPVTKNSEIEQ